MKDRVLSRTGHSRHTYWMTIYALFFLICYTLRVHVVAFVEWWRIESCHVQDIVVARTGWRCVTSVWHNVSQVWHHYGEIRVTYLQCVTHVWRDYFESATHSFEYVRHDYFESGINSFEYVCDMIILNLLYTHLSTCVPYVWHNYFLCATHRK